VETNLEHILVNTYKAEMISYLKAHPEDFDEAIRIAISDKQPYSWRAAWLLWSCMEENDKRVQGYNDDIIKALPTKNDDHQRELIKILQQMELNEEQESYLFDVCVSVWEKVNNKPSVRFNAFKFIVKMAKKYPDLSNEVKFLTQDHYLEFLSAAAKKSISKMLTK